jgi:hypothetical protein
MMNEDFYIEAEESQAEQWAFEPPYDPDDYMQYDDEQDNEWECA